VRQQPQHLPAAALLCQRAALAQLHAALGQRAALLLLLQLLLLQLLLLQLLLLQLLLLQLLLLQLLQ
jgi:hypothetical protein